MTNLLTKLVKRESTSVEWVFISFEYQYCAVKFKDESIYMYKDVSQEAMFILAAHEDVRLGPWVNEHLVHLKRTELPDDITKEIQAYVHN